MDAVVNWYQWAELAPKRRTRKQAKLARRREKTCRKIMVHYAGNALLCYSSRAERAAASAAARGWSTRRPVSVPRRLREILGAAVGGPETWAKAMRLSVNVSDIVACYKAAVTAASVSEVKP